jgi:hypothetical protein
MRNASLHQALRAFTEEAGLQLDYDRSNGAEVPFEVVENPGTGVSLYAYRPLTSEFVRERMGRVVSLPSCGPALEAIARLDGIDAYLRGRGEPRVPASAADQGDALLRTFLSAVFHETDDFAFNSERFDRAYAELEATVMEGRASATIIAPLFGLELEMDQIALGDGFALVRGDTLDDAPAEAVWGEAGGGGAEKPSTLITLAVETKPGDPAPIKGARAAFRRLLTAVRLWDDGAFALGPVAWSRVDSGPWQLASLGGSGRVAGAPLLLVDGDESALREFITVVAARAGRNGGEIAWALARFEMGCDRGEPYDALTDHLLALRTLLEPEGPSSGRLAGRLAALCAVADDRAALAERVAHAISLERALIAGLSPAAPNVDILIADLASHLRGLIRDVTCGHLEPELIELADRIIAGELPAAVEPPEVEPHAADARARAVA